ncbi:MAG: putative transport system ATP-binding protein [Gaiellales bacterium]|nr:putative transport system ATP-binding protein [Gaiellales bacterium]
MSERAGIKVEALSKHYATSAGVVRAVDGVTLEVEPGSSLAVTGPSGCGKSTLLGLMAGLERPSAGSVSLGGHAISSLPARDRERIRRDELGLVFQADNLLPFLTAVENVALQLALSGATTGYERCAELLARLGLAEHTGKLPDQLSGGQRQRVAVARALIHGPRTILADEPTGALDAATSAAVLDVLQDAQRELGATLIVVTHDLAVAGRLDGRLDLRDGRPVDGAAADERSPGA